MPHDYAPHPTGEPRQIEAETSRDVFETLARAVFNAGLSWRVVDRKWPAICEAFEGFEPAAVARYDEESIQRILGRDDVIRSKNKVRGIVKNAATFVDLEDEHGSVLGWLRSMDDYWAREKALTKRFKWLGDFGAFWMLYTLKEPVPPYADWCRAKGKPVPEALRGT
ncbi:MAG: DNA-3-methyladenine glycosylase I [Sandaracinaceae bacterium]